MKINYCSSEDFLFQIARELAIIKIGARIFRTVGDYKKKIYYYVSQDIYCCMSEEAGSPDIEASLDQFPDDSKIIDVKVGTAYMGRIKIVIDSIEKKSEAIYEFLRLCALLDAAGVNSKISTKEIEFLSLDIGAFSLHVKVPGITNIDEVNIINSVRVFCNGMPFDDALRRIEKFVQEFK
jgi:hypothetical protein